LSKPISCIVAFYRKLVLPHHSRSFLLHSQSFLRTSFKIIAGISGNYCFCFSQNSLCRNFRTCTKTWQHYTNSI